MIGRLHAGLKSDDAARIGTEIYGAIHDNVATKADLKSEITAVRADIRELEQRVDVRFANIDLRFANLERRIDQMVVRLGALAVVVAGLLFAALQRWPPH